MPENVQCTKCGYLAMRNLVTRELVEVEVGVRGGGELPEGPSVPSNDQSDFLLQRAPRVYDLPPICFKLVPEFCEETEEWEQTGTHDYFMELIEKQRSCDQWCQWHQGLSPKEHSDMQLTDELLRRQETFQSDQARLADERHAESMAVATKAATIATKAATNAAWIGVGGALLVAFIAPYLSKTDKKSEPPPPVVNVIVPTQSSITGTTGVAGERPTTDQPADATNPVK